MAQLHELLHPGAAAAVVKFKPQGGSGQSQVGTPGSVGGKRGRRRRHRKRKGGSESSTASPSVSADSAPSSASKTNPCHATEGSGPGATIDDDSTACTTSIHAVHHPGHVVNVPFGSLRLGVMRLVASVVNRSPRAALDRCSGEGAIKESKAALMEQTKLAQAADRSNA